MVGPAIVVIRRKIASVQQAKVPTAISTAKPTSSESPRELARVCIDLPFPVSVNALWKIGRSRKTGKRIMYRSKRYMAWLSQADGEWMVQKPKGSFKTIEGAFVARLKLSRPDNRRRDDHNYHKGVMDWAQRAGIIRDDGNSTKTTTEWVEDSEAPMGARLILTVR